MTQREQAGLILMRLQAQWAVLAHDVRALRDVVLCEPDGTIDHVSLGALRVLHYVLTQAEAELQCARTPTNAVRATNVAKP